MIRGVFESVTGKVTDGVRPWMNATRRRAKLRPSSLHFFTHRRLRTRLFMQVGDERRTNGKNFFHPSHRSFLPLSYETSGRRRRRRKNYVYFLVARREKYTCCDKKKVEFKASPQIYGGGFFPLLTKNFSLIVNIPRVNFGNTPPSPAGNWISGARRSCQSESIPGQHF